MNFIGMKKVADETRKLAGSLRFLAEQKVMVGIPSSTAGRKEGPISNAALGYIHENGAPEVNIPARPFLVPGIENAQPDTVRYLRQAMDAALSGKRPLVEHILNAAGLNAVNHVKAKITAGPFEPLKPETIRRRRIRSKGSKYRRKATTAADVKPLIDTGQMRNAITYVIRTKS